MKHLDLSFEEKNDYFVKAIKEKNEITSLLRGKNEEKLLGAKVEIINAFGSFVDEHTIKLDFEDHSEEIKGEKIYINTGSTPFTPPITGLNESKFVYDSSEIMELDQLPEHLIVIGAGYIGLEFASLFNNFGSKVTVVNHDDSFMPKEDNEMADKVLEHMKSVGIEFKFNTSIQSLEDENNQVKVVLDNETMVVDAVLVATGRTPNTDGLNVEAAGVELTERKAIKVDENLKSTTDYIYAMGDVVGGLQFTYISLDDSRILLQEDRSVNNRGSIPYTVFIDPPLSRVGQSEEEIEKEFRVASIPASAIPKTHILRNKAGYLKVLVDSSDLILGAHFFCAESFEMINLVKLAIDQKIPYTVLRDNIYTHPTMTEALNDLLSSFN